MNTIQIKVRSDLAKAYEKITEIQRQDIEEKINLILESSLKTIDDDLRELREIMDDISQEAEENGLTPEILDSILKNEI
jgi:hypothetical protein